MDAMGRSIDPRSIPSGSDFISLTSLVLLLLDIGFGESFDEMTLGER